ncbi:MAG: KamA family radical SAM protein, partial [Gammaproteobacteria bacterium]|nr:KamA family radical SAM protein [Gammaproteobacteria bacterium]
MTAVGDLLDLVGLSTEQVDATQETGFALRVPRPYIARMRRGDPYDPLLRQVLPTVQESQSVAGYGADPLRESSAVVDSGLLRKYAGRVLLIAAGTCAVNCRYCFRRHFPYAEHRQGSDFPALEAVRRDATINEVILSGGDPLVLKDSHFADLVRRIADIDHVRRIRVHTRLPVVIPQRVTAALIDVLASLPQQVVIVLHFNHGNEIDADCVRALTALGRFTLLNQSVLLR